MIIEAILKINPNAQVSIEDNDINQITWFEGTTPISISEIENAILEVQIDKKWKAIREKRNQLLAETDYLALSDNTMSAEMTAYRQALRDLPASTSNPDDVVFPSKP